MRELRFTLYEVLGYFVPGALSFVALVVLLWGILQPSIDIGVINRISRRDLVVLAILIYLLGHLTQAIANWVERILDKSLGAKGMKLAKKAVHELKVIFLEQEMDRRTQGTQPDSVMDRVRSAVRDYYDIGAARLEESTLTQLCDAGVVANGAPEEREIYVYREGFYRGIWLGLLSISFALVSPFVRQWIYGDIVAMAQGLSLRPSPRALAVAALISWTCSCFMYCRYWRFRNYRIDGAFLFFLSVTKKGEGRVSGKRE